MNTNFAIKDLEIKDVKLISPFYVEDNRGFFLKNFEKGVFTSWGLEAEVFETFESYSHYGVIRGLHFQTKNPQIKMVRAIKGRVHDVVVDLRKDSSTFGKYVSVELSEKNHQIIWIPKGFAHGFEVLSEDAILSYKCIGKYLDGYDTGINWADEQLAIPWEIKNPIVSERDRNLMTLSQFIGRYIGL